VNYFYRLSILIYSPHKNRAFRSGNMTATRLFSLFFNWRMPIEMALNFLWF